MTDYLRLAQETAPEQSAAAEEVNPYLDIARGDSEGQRARARTVLELALKDDPELAAERQRLSKTAGVPLPVVVRNLEELRVKERARMVDLAGMAEQSPVLYRQLVDPTFTSVASDDIPILTKLERAMRYTLGTGKGDSLAGDVGRAGVDVAFGATAGVGEGIFNITGVVYDLLGWESGALDMRTQANRSRDARQSFGLQGQSSTEQAIKSGLGSAGTNLALLPAGLSRGLFATAEAAATAVSATMGTMVGADAYLQGREAGLGKSQATAFGLTQGSFEFLMEKVPTGKLFGDLAGNAGLMKTLRNQAISETWTEQLTTLAQDFNEWVNLHPEKTTAEFIAERPEAAYQTLVATLVGVGVQTSMLQGINKIVEKASDQALVFEQDRLKEMLKAAGESALRERSPEQFRAHVERMVEETDGAKKEIYVDAEVLAQLAPEVLAQLPVSAQEQMQAALESGSTVSIPMADVLTIAPGTPLEQTLNDYARMTPDAITRTEAKEAGDVLKQDAERILAQAQDQVAARQEFDAVQQDLAQQITATGRYRPAVSEAYSAGLTHFFVAYGQRTGLGTQGLYDAYKNRGFQIVGEAGAQGGQLEQPQTVGAPTFKKTHTDRDGATYEIRLSQEVVGRGADRQLSVQVEAYQGEQRRARVDFALDGNTLASENTITAVSFRGKGLAEAMYRAAREAGYDIAPGKVQTDAGLAMVEKLQKKGLINKEAQGPRFRAGNLDLVPLEGGRLAQSINQTETPEFKKWFGDSKVVDAEGKPLVVYHGTNQDIDKFDASRLGNNTRANSAIAFFFSEDPREASEYAILAGKQQRADAVKFEKRVAELQKQIQAAEKRGDFNAQERFYLELEEFETTARETDDENSGQNVVATYLKIDNPQVVDMQGTYDGTKVTKIIKDAKKKGFDGVKLLNVFDPAGDRPENFTTTQWLAFNPEQIKSVTGNDGSFDTNDPSILSQQARGTFSPATLELVLNSEANLSTLWHEMGHFFLEVLSDVATQPNAPAQLIEDYATVLNWFGVADEQWRGFALDEKRPYHERWAESIEQYVMEGKVPNAELAPLMRRFAAWLKSVYGSIKQMLAARGQEVGGDVLGQPAYHGTPHRGIEKFSADKIGTGEGAQAYGWGLYFASKKEVAEHYRKGLSYRDIVRQFRDALPDDASLEEALDAAKSGELAKPMVDVIEALAADDWLGFDYPAQAITAAFKELDQYDAGPDLREAVRDYGGQLYKVEIPEDTEMLLWDKPLSEQPPKVRKAMQAADKRAKDSLYQNGAEYYRALTSRFANNAPPHMSVDQGENWAQKYASDYLASLGIKGIKYLDGTSRGAGDGTFNYVVFSGEDVQIHEQFYQNPNAQPRAQMQLNDDIRRVMDRMLATDEQIAQANEVAGLMPDEAADGEAQERLRKRSMADLKWTVRARDKAIRDLQKKAAGIRKTITAEVTEEANTQPEMQAQAALDALKKDKNLNDSTALVVADSFGYPSVQAMQDAIDKFGKKQDYIDGRTEQRMLEEHGDLINDDVIKEAANEAVHNEARARSLASELRTQAEMLRTRTPTGETSATGRKVTVNVLLTAAKQFGANVVGKTTLRDLKGKAWEHTAAERRAAKKWQEATSAGKTQEAVRAKQDQVMNNAAAKAALEARAEGKKILEFFARVLKGNNETVVEKGRDPDIVNAARSVLQLYGLESPASKGAAAYLESLKRDDPETWSAIEPMVAAASTNAQPILSLTFDDLIGLNEQIQAMWHLAKRSRQMEVDGNLLDIEEVAAEVSARLEEIGIPDRIPGEGMAVTKAEERGLFLKQGIAFLRRVEQWAEGMDGKYGGPFLRYVFQPVKDAADRYRKDRVAFRKRYQALVDSLAPIVGDSVIEAQELGYTFGTPGSSAGTAMNEILHALLHTGNESNKRKLLVGRGWGAEGPNGELDTRRWDAFVQRLVNEGKLQREHMDFVQGVWDLLEDTKPLAQKTHRDVFGHSFADVTADEFTDPFGVKRRGGYVPAQVDSRLVKDNTLKNLAEEENNGMTFAFPQPAKGFTMSRVEGYNRPLMLDLRTLSQHIDKVLLFSHMTPATRGVRKLLTNKRVASPLDRVQPAAVETMLQPWLQRSAQQVVETPVVGASKWARIPSVIRSRAGMALMFANVSNTVQQITGLSSAAVRVKPAHLMRSVAQYVANPRQFSAAVWKASPYMDDRAKNEVAIMNEQAQDILIRPGVYSRAQSWSMRHAYFLQTAVDNILSPIVWAGAYNQALTEGMTDTDAVKFADGTVRQTQGSTLPEDVSRFETGPAYSRVFTQFVGYFNMMANTNGTALKQVASEIGLKKGAGKALYIVTMGLMAPIWVAEAIAQAFKGGPDDEDKDGYLDDWLAAVFGFGTAKGLLAQVPVLGQVAMAGVNRINDNPMDDRVSLSPAVSLLESAVSTPGSVYKAIVDDGSVQKAVRDVATLVSVATGIPVSGLARPAGYLAGVADGKINPTSGGDMARGLLTGVASPESKVK